MQEYFTEILWKGSGTKAACSPALGEAYLPALLPKWHLRSSNRFCDSVAHTWGCLYAMCADSISATCDSSSQFCALGIAVHGICFLASLSNQNFKSGPTSLFFSLLIFHPGKSKNTSFGCRDGCRLHSSTDLNAIQDMEQLLTTSYWQK